MAKKLYKANWKVSGLKAEIVRGAGVGDSIVEGTVIKVEPSEARSLVANGTLTALEGGKTRAEHRILADKLDDTFPGYDALKKSSLTTFGDIRADLDNNNGEKVRAVKGIGPTTYDEIVKVMDAEFPTQK